MGGLADDELDEVEEPTITNTDVTNDEVDEPNPNPPADPED